MGKPTGKTARKRIREAMSPEKRRKAVRDRKRKEREIMREAKKRRAEKRRAKKR